MKKKTIGIIAISVLFAFAIFAGAMFTHQYIDAKNSVEQFDELTDLIADVETGPETESPEESESTEEPELSEEELAAAQAALAHEKYGALVEQNEDFIGWIKIDGTKIDYPVEVTKTTLYITVSHKTADEMSDQYRFNDDQDSQLEELLNVDNSMWLAVLYGMRISFHMWMHFGMEFRCYASL